MKHEKQSNTTLISIYKKVRLQFLYVSLMLAVAVAASPPASAQVNRVGILGSGQGCQWSTVGAAIAVAGAGSTILIEAGYTFNERLGTISKPVTIAAGNAACTALSLGGAKPVIDAANLGRVATISGDVTFRYVELRNGEVTDLRGGNLLVTASGDLILDDVLVAEGVLHLSFAQTFNTFAAGIHLETGSNLVMRGASDLFHNQAMSGWGVGGLVIEAGATATLEDTSRIGEFLAGNTSVSTAGGALVEGALILADDAEVSGNVGGLVGGIYVNGGNVELRDRARVAVNSGRSGGILVQGGGRLTTGPDATPIVERNIGGSYAGGIAVPNGVINGNVVEVSDISISANTTESCGAGLYIDDALASVSLEAAVLDANEATECGGGIALLAGDLTLNDVEIINNHAGTDGGGLYLNGAGSVTVATDARINGNSSRVRGGGVAQFAGAALTLHRSDITNNSAVSDGGGLYVAGPASVLSADGGSISQNSAGRGAGVYADAGTITLDYQKINGNDALSEGGAIRVTAGAMVDVNFGHVKHNTAGTMGGGFAVPGAG